MSVNKTVHRLNVDIQRYKKAQQQHNKDLRTERRDVKAGKQDHRQLDGLVKKGKAQHKALDRDRKGLQKDTAARAKALADIAAKKQALMQQFPDAFTPDPLNPNASLPNPMLQAGLQQLADQEAAVHAKFDGRIDSERARVDGDRTGIQSTRDAISAKRGEISKDRKALKHDRNALKHDRNVLKRDRKKALKDLLPAEYKMGLKGTNRARHALGLKSVHQVIRPGVRQTVPGQVGKWIAQAQTILKQHGIPLSKMNARDIATIIRFESGGNPNAQNNWDSNAAAGHPSIGLMQTIGPTFNAYKLKGHNNIRNPIDNIIAGVRYAISRYGSIGNVPGIRAVHAGGHYVGY